MRKNINLFLERIIYDYKQRKLCNRIRVVLFLFILFLTIRILIQPATTLGEVNSYTFNIKDNYDYSWKAGLVTEYNLKLYFMDTMGNYIEGKDVVFEIGPESYGDDPYGFGYIPISGDATRGMDLIKSLNLTEMVLPTGEKYVFEYAEVYVDDIWHRFSISGNHWDIWCQGSSSESASADYGWRGKYENEIRYDITNTTEYRFIYKLVRQGLNETVESLGIESGISFKMFNYSGDNSEMGINANGLYKYFTFRGIGDTSDKHINSILDEDGFTDNRAKVLPRLDSDGYPVFDCGDECNNDIGITNTSLGYLFGSDTNANGNSTVGVESYKPINTLLQKEIIDGVEYYYYDSNRNAVDYDVENNRFMLRDYVERGYTMTTYVNENDRYEFQPFNYWVNDMSKSINTSNQREYNYEVSEIDHWYGMTMEFTFYMPSGGVIDDKDMIFSFSGDDDVWVFIDDVLVLDLGGTHGAVDGTINFKTGIVESFLNWNGTLGDKNITNIYNMFLKANAINDVKWASDNKTFEDYTKHTLKFFYLERGASVANCKIRFNIPVLPLGSLSVQKQFDGVDKYDEEYEFILYDVTTNVPVANAEYTIGQDKYRTDENGKFMLKNTQVAVFKLANEHTYYVEETNTGDYAVSYQCTLNGVLCSNKSKTNEFLILPESAYQVVFINKIKMYDLNISKVAYDSVDDEIFEFKIKLRDENTYLVDILENISLPTNCSVDYNNNIISFGLKNNETITIGNIPINTLIKLEEINHDGYHTIIKSGDVILANGDTYEFILDSAKEITVYNTPGIILPETGGKGIFVYLSFGLCFILIALKYGCFFKVKEGES